MAVTVLAVDNSNMSQELQESRAKMEILELYIQSMVSSTEATTNIDNSEIRLATLPQPPSKTKYSIIAPVR